MHILQYDPQPPTFVPIYSPYFHYLMEVSRTSIPPLSFGNILIDISHNVLDARIKDGSTSKIGSFSLTVNLYLSILVRGSRN